ncbi:MAG: hypothetical protein ACRDKG_00810 [Actinomycetota bacterium]
MSVTVTEILSRAREAINAPHVFGEPIHENGVIVVPASAIRGGGGGGGGPHPSGTGEGGGGGFGLMARPVGAYVIRGDQVEWRPAIDVTRLATAGAAVAGLAILTIRTAIKKRRR